MTQFSESSAFVGNDSLPIRHHGDVYRGKIRAVFWLTPDDCARLIEQRGYSIPADAPLGLMVISDKISAFDCVWRGAGGLGGVPGKGAALNAISLHYFRQLEAAGVAPHHVVEVAHPLMWVVRKARPLRLEAILRQYITGSMWRAYDKGERRFCGIELPEGLQKNQKLPSLLLTPSTKGTLVGLEGVPETEDAPISMDDIRRHIEAFGLQDEAQLDAVEAMARACFSGIASHYGSFGQLLVDTKFEFGWIDDLEGRPQLSLIDEIGTPDSSRLWEQEAYTEGRVVESCKEAFRQYLLDALPRDILLDGTKMTERKALAQRTEIPQDVFASVASIYQRVAQSVCDTVVPGSEQPKEEILRWLHEADLLDA